MSDSLLLFVTHEHERTRFPCSSLSPRVCSNSCPLSQWCHPTTSSSVAPFSSCLQSFPASESFPVSQLFVSGGQSIGVSVSTSVLPMNIHNWFSLELTSLIFLLSKELSRVFFSTTIQKHQLFSTHLYLWSNSYIHTCELILLSSFYSLRKIKIKSQIIHWERASWLNIIVRTSTQEV